MKYWNKLLAWIGNKYYSGHSIWPKKARIGLENN